MFSTVHSVAKGSEKICNYVLPTRNAYELKVKFYYYYAVFVYNTLFGFYFFMPFCWSSLVLFHYSEV